MLPSLGEQAHGIAQILATAITTMIITSCFTTVRICTRGCIKRVWGIGDWLFVTAQAVFIALGATTIVGAMVGAKPWNLITVDDISKIRHWYFASELLYVFCSAFLRPSVGLLLLGIRQGVERRCTYTYIIYAIIGFHTLTAIASIIYLLAQCRPVSFFWEKVHDDVPGHCVPRIVFRDMCTMTAIIGAVADGSLATLPFFFIWNVRMDFRTKVSVCALLSLGMITCIVASIRASVIREKFTANGRETIVVFSLIELAIGICCAAASTFRPLFQRWDERSNLANSIELRTMRRAKARTWYGSWYERRHASTVTEPESAFVQD